MPGDGYALYVATGYKAGLMALHLPAEAAAGGGAPSAAWLAANWRFWVWPAGDPAEVEVLSGYDPPRRRRVEP